MTGESAGAPRGLLLDLDDTLYDYVPAENVAREAVLVAVAEVLGPSRDAVATLWDTARRTVKTRLGERGSAHSRLLYLAELVHAARMPSALSCVRAWEKVYWDAFLSTATLRPGALALLTGWRASGRRLAIVTDLTLDVQLRKLEAFDLWQHVDVLVTSEEVLSDKPAPDAFLLAVERLGMTTAECVVVGDSVSKDGAGARALGMAYLQAVSSSTPGGLSFEAIARELGVTR